jgi:hypothetical protein
VNLSIVNLTGENKVLSNLKSKINADFLKLRVPSILRVLIVMIWHVKVLILRRSE